MRIYVSERSNENTVYQPIIFKRATDFMTHVQMFKTRMDNFRKTLLLVSCARVQLARHDRGPFSQQRQNIDSDL